MAQEKILITGAAGMLGKQLISQCPDVFEPVGVDLKEFDITDLSAFRKWVGDVRPAHIIHGAAMTNVDGCETAIEGAMKVNGFGARNAAIAAEEAGASILYVSTDYVFDGEHEGEYFETDPTCPMSSYGRSKLAGEIYTMSLTNRYHIVRTQWLYGAAGKNFVDTIKNAGHERDELNVVNDQHGCPTYARDLTNGIYHILTQDAGYGIYHCSGKGSCTWFDFAKKIVELSGGKAVVHPMSSEKLDRPAPRPRNSALRNLSLELTVGDPTPPWEDALRDYLTA